MITVYCPACNKQGFRINLIATCSNRDRCPKLFNSVEFIKKLNGEYDREFNKMTREEAIELWTKHVDPRREVPIDVARKVVDGFIALGILNVKEEMTVERAIVIAREGTSLDNSKGFISDLEKLGYKIVRKNS